MHRWVLVDRDWFINCEKEKDAKKHKTFNNDQNCFRQFGICPFCGENARKELKLRKEQKEEMSRIKEEQRLREEYKTLRSYIKK